jgi:hypothetical protein
MEIQNFNSLLELFCAFNFAYVLTDSLRSGSYVLDLGEKVLRCFAGVSNSLKKIAEELTSDEIALKETELPTDKVAKERYETAAEDIGAFRIDYNELAAKVKKDMTAAYRTPSFIYLALLLAFYCIVILFLAGLYRQADIVYNNKMDNTVLMVNFFTIVFLIFGWFLDSSSKNAHKLIHWLHSLNQFINVSWFSFVISYFLIAVFISVLFFYLSPISLPEWMHDFNVAVSIILPVSNFIMYFFKIRRRAGRKEIELKQLIADCNTNWEQLHEEVTYVLRLCSDYAGKPDPVDIIQDQSGIK